MSGALRGKHPARRTRGASPARRAGFTFVEVLAALVFLGILIPVVVSALTLSNRTGVVSERSTVAAQLADNRLNELMPNNEWVSAETRGDCGEEWPDFRWELTRADWEGTEMVELTMHVFFQVQGREHEVHLSTLVSEALTAPVSDAQAQP